MWGANMDRITRFPEYPLSEDETNKIKLEGWVLSLTSAYNGDYYQIQKFDESDIFENDQEAWVFVNDGAIRHDPLAVKVLEFIKNHSPMEHREMTLVMGGFDRRDIDKALSNLRKKIVAEELKNFGQNGGKR